MADGQDGDRLRATETRRLDLLSKIGSKRNSVVIAYLTSTRPSVLSADSIEDRDIEIIESHVSAAKAMGARNIDLLLTTHGGDAVAPWGLVAMIREYFPKGSFRVIIPSVAYSAGTGISLGADEIVMGPSSILGPTDTQFVWPIDGRLRRASASDFQGFLDLVRDQGVSRRLARQKTMEWMTARMDAPAIGALYRVWKENRRKLTKILESRNPPLRDSQNRKIINFLLYEIGNHGQSIRRKEARDSGISYITDLERTGIESQVSDLFGIYSDLLKLNVPFARKSRTLGNIDQVGDESDYDIYGTHLSEIPVAIVESQHATNPAYVAYDLRHWDKAPPLPGSSAATGRAAATAEDDEDDRFRGARFGGRERTRWVSSRVKT